MVDQNSALWVKLADIVEEMDFQSDEQSSFLNLTTGEVVSITDEELRAGLLQSCFCKEIVDK
jgi:hypothetical protein